MVTREVSINSNLGLHAGSAVVLARASAKFDSLVEIEYKGLKADAKSLIGILSLGIGNGEKVKLIVSGLDEENAVDEIVDTIEKIK